MRAPAISPPARPGPKPRRASAGRVEATPVRTNAPTVAKTIADLFMANLLTECDGTITRLSCVGFRTTPKLIPALMGTFRVFKQQSLPNWAFGRHPVYSRERTNCGHPGSAVSPTSIRDERGRHWGGLRLGPASTIPAGCRDEQGRGDGKHDSGGQAREQPFAADREGCGDYRQTSHHSGNVCNGRRHPTSLTQTGTTLKSINCAAGRRNRQVHSATHPNRPAKSGPFVKMADATERPERVKLRSLVACLACRLYPQLRK